MNEEVDSPMDISRTVSSPDITLGNLVDDDSDLKRQNATTLLTMFATYHSVDVTI